LLFTFHTLPKTYLTNCFSVTASFLHLVFLKYKNFFEKYFYGKFFNTICAI